MYEMLLKHFPSNLPGRRQLFVGKLFKDTDSLYLFLSLVDMCFRHGYFQTGQFLRVEVPASGCGSVYNLNSHKKFIRPTVVYTIKVILPHRRYVRLLK